MYKAVVAKQDSWHLAIGALPSGVRQWLFY